MDKEQQYEDFFEPSLFEFAHVEEISSYLSKLEKFNSSMFVSNFTINDRESIDPFESLVNIFERLINQAIEKSNFNKDRVNFSILIFSEGLNEPILIPCRSYDQNAAWSIVERIRTVGNSNDHLNLLNRNLKAIVSTVEIPGGRGIRKLKHEKVVDFFGRDETQLIKIRNTNNNLCLFYACEMARINNDEKIIQTFKPKGQHPKILKSRSVFIRYCQQEKEQRWLANRLVTKMGIPNNLDSYGLEYVKQIQECYDKFYPHMYRIVVFTKELGLTPIVKGEPRKYYVPIYLSNNHFDGIKNINKFFQLYPSRLCVDCVSTYADKTKHTVNCAVRCNKCSGMGPDFPCLPHPNIHITCHDCNRVFFNESCYTAHMPGTCRQIKKCPVCCKEYQVTRTPHECGFVFCRRCKVHHGKRSCKILKLHKPKKPTSYRIVALDFEASQDLEKEFGVFEHKVNFISARFTCSECLDERREGCPICICDSHKTWSGAEMDNPLNTFIDWIMNAFPKKYKTLIYAHYGSKYDHHFILNRLYNLGIAPKLTMSGLKIYEMKVNKSKKSLLQFRDSYLITNVPLSSLVDTFGLDCEQKLYFPHLYNKAANYHTVLPHLPPFSDYIPGSKKHEDYLKMEEWYNENWGNSFLLSSELDLYCSSDTLILMKALMAIRKIMLEMSDGLDVFFRCCTTAGVSMSIFRYKHYQKENLYVVPEGGYERHDRQSVIGLKWLDWYAHTNNVRVRHSGNGGEFQEGRYKLDGYMPVEKIALEFNGCYIHGHPECTKPHKLGPNGRTHAENYAATTARLYELEHSPDLNGVIVKWECEVQKELKSNKEMKEFFDSVHSKGPIDPRDAFSGGRTAPSQLISTVSEGKAHKIVDINSLYPACMYNCEMPVGLPEIYYPDYLEVNWTCPADIPIKGLLKVLVVPPIDLLIPVLPLRVNESLLFPLCVACARYYQKNNNKSDVVCKHTDKERSFITTVTHIELAKALENGYRVVECHRGWEYKEWDSDLFKPFVRELLKLKIQSSGFPDGVRTDEEKLNFCKEYNERFGIDLKPDQIKFNPGLRHLAKIGLNSLYGKFSMRNNLSHTKVIVEPSEFFDLFLDQRYEVQYFMPVSENAMRVCYKERKEYVEEHNVSNIIISLFVTSYGRLVLYDYMRQVQDTPGAGVLYTDTDSICYFYEIGNDPITEGKFLGDMSVEYKGYNILQFISGGPKQYGLELEKDGIITHVLKVRGITLDENSTHVFGFEKLKKMILNFGNSTNLPVSFIYDKFGPTSDSLITCKKLIKKYIPICKKGMIDSSFRILPFGYKPPA